MGGQFVDRARDHKEAVADRQRQRGEMTQRSFAQMRGVRGGEGGERGKGVSRRGNTCPANVCISALEVGRKVEVGDPDSLRPGAVWGNSL